MPTRRTLLAAAATLPLAGAPAARAQSGSFAALLDSVAEEARRAGIREQTIRIAFAGVAPNPHIIDLDHHQAEFTLSWPQYRDKVIPPARIQAGRANYARQGALLGQVQQRFAVDPLVIMGIWGIESAFGANKGSYRLVEALATLAWEGRRAAYFRKELVNALRILDNGDITPERMTAGWAGAMGQPQFMPSSYLAYAVDFDGDGRRDIWDDLPDVFGSIANYLARNGWRGGEPWGQPVRVPLDFDASVTGRDNRRPLGAWMRMGVRRSDGSPFSRADVPGALVLPDGIAPGEGFMTYANFNVIRRYNPSDFYALAVGLLGDAAVT